MEVNRVTLNKTDFKDMKSGLNSQHFYSEVVLIEQPLQGAEPKVYQLKKDQLSTFNDLDILRQEFIRLPHPAFSFLGNVVEVNMNKKTILMDNNNLVSYKFLLLVTSIAHEEETSVALHTLKDALLIDALDVKNKMHKEQNAHPKFFMQSHKKKRASHSFSVPEASICRHYKYIEKLVQRKMPESTTINDSPEFHTSIKKLCFLQT